MDGEGGGWWFSLGRVLLCLKLHLYLKIYFEMVISEGTTRLRNTFWTIPKTLKHILMTILKKTNWIRILFKMFISKMFFNIF